MPYFSLRSQLWNGKQVEPGDPLESSRPMLSMVRAGTAMFVPEGYKINRRPGAKGWDVIPAGGGAPMDARQVRKALEDEVRGRPVAPAPEPDPEPPKEAAPERRPKRKRKAGNE